MKNSMTTIGTFWAHLFQLEFSTSQPVPQELYWSCTKNCRGSDGLEKNFGIDSTWSAKCLRNDFFFLLRNRRFGTIQTHDPWLREIIYFFYAESSWHDAMSRRFSVLRDLTSDNSRTKKCSVWKKYINRRRNDIVETHGGREIVRVQSPMQDKVYRTVSKQNCHLANAPMKK